MQSSSYIIFNRYNFTEYFREPKSQGDSALENAKKTEGCFSQTKESPAFAMKTEIVATSTRRRETWSLLLNLMTCSERPANKYQYSQKLNFALPKKSEIKIPKNLFLPSKRRPLMRLF